MLKNKKIIVALTGSIAAYKAAELVRLIKKSEAEVRIIMTDAAKEFITPITMQALSGHPIHSNLLDTEAEAAMAIQAYARGHMARALRDELLSERRVAGDAAAAAARARQADRHAAALRRAAW